MSIWAIPIYSAALYLAMAIGFILGLLIGHEAGPVYDRYMRAKVDRWFRRMGI